MSNNDSGMGLVFDMLDEVRRSWWTVAAGLCIGLASAMVALAYMPKVYEATTKIYLAPPKIPKEYVDTTVVDDSTHRLWLFNEAVVSPAYMQRLIEREFDLLTTEEERQAVTRHVRANVTTEVAGKLGYFELSYRDHDPELTARIANTLADLYIEQNKESRSSRAEETTRTMQERADDAHQELERQRKEIHDFQHEHRFELSDYLNTNFRKLDYLKADLETNADELDEVAERITQLERVIARRSGGDTTLTDLPGVELDPFLARIQAMEQELDQLLVHYSEEHPTVKSKKRALEELRAAGPDTPDGEGAEGGAQPADDPLAIQLAALQKELGGLRNDRREMEREVTQIERRIERTPENDQELARLTDGYGMLTTKYGRLLAQAESAEDVEWLESNQQGRQFEIIEPAKAPRAPIEPDPIRIYLVCLVVGIALFIGPLLLRRVLTPVITSEASLLSSIDVPVLATIPRISTPATRSLTTRRTVKNLGLSLLSAAVLAAVMVTFG